MKEHTKFRQYIFGWWMLCEMKPDAALFDGVWDEIHCLEREHQFSEHQLCRMRDFVKMKRER